MGFSVKQIEVRITLGKGTFGGKGSEKVINGLPVRVRISKPGGKDKNKAKIGIGGMAYADMEQLTTLAFRPLQTDKNLIAVYAGDAESGLSQVFSGEITTASADFNRAPDPVFNIEAMAGYYPALIAAGPQSVAGTMSAADFIAMQAQAAGYSFDNQGVTSQIKDCIFNGSPVQKAQSCAAQVGATLLIDDNAFILLPPGQARKGDAVVLTPQTGMIGYPTFSSDGIEVTAVFDPAFQLGGLIQVESVVPKASGVWRITKLEHSLSANEPGDGRWESRIFAAYEANRQASSVQGTV